MVDDSSSIQNLQPVSDIKWYGQGAWPNHSGSERAAGSPATPSKRSSIATRLCTHAQASFCFGKEGSSWCERPPRERYAYFARRELTSGLGLFGLSNNPETVLPAWYADMRVHLHFRVVITRGNLYVAAYGYILCAATESL